MSEVFISYARATEAEARRFADALRALGYGVWRDDELPPHRAYAEVIEERLRAAKAVLVVWSPEAVKSQWVRAEAEVARMAGTLVQLSLGGAAAPLPFNQIQCDDLSGWSGDADAPAWRKITASIAALAGGAARPAAATPAPVRASKPSIAILPFANLSGDADQEYFADGMVEEIAGALGRFKSIFVVASGSSLTFKNRTVGPREAARSLGVRYLLEGSVRRAAGRVRITARLIDGEDGAQIWAERFEDTLDDLFALQDKVALAVAGAIEPAVRESEIRRASRRPTDSQGGYDLYLRALALYRAHTQAENFQALDLLGRAITLDPEFGAAIALAASAHSRIVAFAWSEDVEGNRRQGVELARRALRLAGDDPDVFIRAASVLSYDTADDVAGFFERALALNPASAIAHLAMSDYHLMHGDPKLGQAHIETAMRLDPLSPLRATHLGMLGSALFMQGRFAEAIAPLRESVHLQAAPPQSFAVLAACHGQLGEIEAARAALAEVRARTQAPIRELGANLIRAPAQRRLFLEGIARAEDEAP